MAKANLPQRKGRKTKKKSLHGSVVRQPERQLSVGVLPPEQRLGRVFVHPRVYGPEFEALVGDTGAVVHTFDLVSTPNGFVLQRVPGAPEARLVCESVEQAQAMLARIAPIPHPETPWADADHDVLADFNEGVAREGLVWKTETKQA